MKVQLESAQVCELTAAKLMLFHAGCGQRRVDGDTLGVYLERGNSFYTPSPDKPHTNLMVDEGSYTGALHVGVDNEGTSVSHSLPWLEYVDMGDLMTVLVRKLVGEVKYTSGPYIGRGKNQRHQMDQSIAYLRKWSQENPDHKLKFI